MSIALATRGVIAGLGGAGGSGADVPVPVCAAGPELVEEVGQLTFTAEDPSALPPVPGPTDGIFCLPNKRSREEILPTKNTYGD